MHDARFVSLLNQKINWIILEPRGEKVRTSFDLLEPATQLLVYEFRSMGNVVYTHRVGVYTLKQIEKKIKKSL